MDLPSVRIGTERLLLLPIERRWSGDIFREFTAEITRWMYPKPAERIEETEAFIDSSLAGLERGDNLQLVITLAETGEFLGCVGLHGVGTREPEVGIWVKKGAHGQGYGLEAGTALIAWARKNLIFDFLRYPVDKRNRASRRIPEATGGVVVREFPATGMAGQDLDEVEYRIPFRALEFRDIGESAELRMEAARVLMRAFADHADSAWPDMKKAAAEVEECLEGRNFCLGVLVEGRLAGWAGLRPLYDKTWELHPMAVDPRRQGRGLGRALLGALEAEARRRGLEGILLGTDDEDGRTSLSALDLDGTNALAELASIRNTGRHPFGFYRNCGYALVGVVPNANGRRRPDIWMWKGL